jgi:hypothetical protein
LNRKEAKKENESERRKILEDMRKTNAEKANMIKKALAAQRAKFGAGGGGNGLSSEAVLRRLQSETAESYDEKLRAAAEKLRKIKTPKTNFLKMAAKYVGI